MTEFDNSNFEKTCAVLDGLIKDRSIACSMGEDGPEKLYTDLLGQRRLQAYVETSPVLEDSKTLVVGYRVGRKRHEIDLGEIIMQGTESLGQEEANTIIQQRLATLLPIVSRIPELLKNKPLLPQLEAARIAGDLRVMPAKDNMPMTVFLTQAGADMLDAAGVEAQPITPRQAITLKQFDTEEHGMAVPLFVLQQASTLRPEQHEELLMLLDKAPGLEPAPAKTLSRY